tara:strand:+ start:1265 stop:1753 length:489 start_codon:yes stop_codon:yes gene_type:complete
MVNYIVGRWATKYKYLPTDIRFEGSCEERIQHLKARGYGLYSNIGQESSIVYWQENCQRLEAELRLLQIQKEQEQRLLKEAQRIADVKKEQEQRLRLKDFRDRQEITLQIQLENQIKQNELKREKISMVKTENQVPAVVAASSLIPLGVLAILLINSSRGKK